MNAIEFIEQISYTEDPMEAKITPSELNSILWLNQGKKGLKWKLITKNHSPRKHLLGVSIKKLDQHFPRPKIPLILFSFVLHKV